MVKPHLLEEVFFDEEILILKTYSWNNRMREVSFLIVRTKQKARRPFSYRARVFCFHIKVVLHGTIRNDDFKRETALQHCCAMFQMVATLFQHCNAVLR